MAEEDAVSEQDVATTATDDAGGTDDVGVGTADNTVGVDTTDSPDAGDGVTGTGAEDVGKSSKPDVEQVGDSVMDNAAPSDSVRRAVSLGGAGIPIVLVAAAAIMLIAAAVVAIVSYRQAVTRERELDARAAATKAGCDFGHTFTDFSADRIDDYLARVGAASTGDWKKWVQESGPTLKQAVVEKQVNSIANNVHCGYRSGGETSAEVVVVIDQSFSTATEPGASDRSRLAAVVDMRKDGGMWLVAGFDTPALTPLGK